MRAEVSGGLPSAFMSPQLWEDTTVPLNFYQFNNVEIQVTGVTGTWTPARSKNGTFVACNAYDKDGLPVTTITADGIYSLEGRAQIKLTGGSAGAFTVSAGN